MLLMARRSKQNLVRRGPSEIGGMNVTCIEYLQKCGNAWLGFEC
jgi:hypothetical protein